MKNLPYLTYSVSRDSWDPDELGNHRAVVEVDQNTEIVRVRIPWRRRDEAPNKKGILLYSERGTHIDNYLPVEVRNTYGEFLFQPEDGPGRYYFYFLPYTGDVKVPYPNAEYLPPELSDNPWRSKYRGKECSSAVEARTTGLECVDEFNRFTEMELIADEVELENLRSAHIDRAFVLFPEYRSSPIRMFHAIPKNWAVDKNVRLEDRVRRGEMYIFQIGLYAHHEALHDVSVLFADLKDDAGATAAPAEAMRCFNTGGRAWNGQPLRIDVSVKAGFVQALWCGVSIGDEATPGDYETRVTVDANGERQSFPVHLTVIDDVIPHHGDDNPELLARLRWIDSDIGTNDEIVPPFTPVKVNQNRIDILGRALTISESGLPGKITSFFRDDLNSITGPPLELLARPATFEVILKDGRNVPLTSDSTGIVEAGNSFVTWRTVSRADFAEVTIDATMEFDGTVEYGIRLATNKQIEVADIRLTASFRDEVAKLMTGLGRKGGAAPDSFSWTWDVKRNQDAVWIGTVNGGVQFTFKDKRYSRPLNTNFYQMKPLIMPESWCNDYNGGIRLQRIGGNYELCSFSGPRILRAGDVLDFDMRLLITPFKPMDTADHFKTRFFHQYESIDKIVARGGNTINIHHATKINPYINYPFLTPELMKTYIAEAHNKGCRVKLYYTTRELTTRTPEFFALKSLGHEIFVDGKRGGHAWLQEHVDGGYLSAWYSLEVRDTSAINGIVSRWHNFYVEGMNWLAENLEIDGVYIDDIGFGREIMKRVRRVLHHHREKPVIDFHSANQYNERDGFASSTNLYMEHFPFLDRLWFGEYFDYNETPEYWLLEMSGIPFGLLSEMLQDGGNPWRGMVFGMTGRMPRVENQPLWEVWDRYRLVDTKMIGYWSESCPVSVQSADIKCTAYIGDTYTIIALASWQSKTALMRLEIDWRKAGIEKSVKRIFAPAIDNFQNEIQSVHDAEISIEPGKGLLVVVEH